MNKGTFDRLGEAQYQFLQLQHISNRRIASTPLHKQECAVM